MSGAVFAEISNRMTGVDLSAKMLDLVEKRGMYTRLAHADINQAPNQNQEKFDLILSADDFCLHRGP